MGAFKGWMNTRKNLLFAKFQSLPGRYIRNFYPLDEFPGATAAYSVRKLAANYNGPCLQVRRSSDNTTQDIYFNGDSVNTSAILSFVAGGNGFISIWYDQSGNGNDFYQNTLVSQPRIALAGVIETVENRPAIYFDGSNDYLQLTTSLSANQGYLSTSVTKRTAISTKGIMNFCADKQSAATGVYASTQWFDNIIYLSSTNHNSRINFTGSDQIYITAGIKSNIGNLHVNGTKKITTNFALTYSDNFTYMARRELDYCIGWIQEAIYWPSYSTDFGKSLYQNQVSFFKRV